MFCFVFGLKGLTGEGKSDSFLDVERLRPGWEPDHPGQQTDPAWKRAEPCPAAMTAHLGRKGHGRLVSPLTNTARARLNFKNLDRVSFFQSLLLRRRRAPLAAR